MLEVFVILEKCEKEFKYYLEDMQKDAVELSTIVSVIKNMIEIIISINRENIYHIDNHVGNFMICGSKLKLIDFGKGKVF